MTNECENTKNETAWIVDDLVLAGNPRHITMKAAHVAPGGIYGDPAEFKVTPLHSRPDVQTAAQVLLEQLEEIWSAQMSTVTHNARHKAEKDGHKYRVIDREGFRAALAHLAEQKE